MANIITSIYVNPLTINNNISLIEMNKLDRDKTIILVDTSYWLYCRYFALRNWYRKAYPECTNNPNFNLEHNWLKDEIFINKYKKLFINNIKSICKINKTVLTNVVFCLDCAHTNIWRLDHNTEYKKTRLNSHIKNEFNAYDLFKYIKTSYLPELHLLYGIKIIYNNKCEADDIIGHMAPFLINEGYNNIIIVANDNDYLQICSNNIIMVNNHQQYNYNKHILYGEKYLINKILTGDRSDNIKCCKINTGFIENGIANNNNKNIYTQYSLMLINNPNIYNIFKDNLYKIRSGGIKSYDDDDNLKYINNFYNNTLLMDFQMLPLQLKNELLTKFNNYI